MPTNPFKPPQSTVADTETKRPAKWGRGSWIHLSFFGFVALLGIPFARENASAFTFSSLGIALILTALFLFRPLKSMFALSEEASPWYWDFLYYASVVLGIAAAVEGNMEFFIAICLPSLLLNGFFGIAAVVVEYRNNVRVYSSARRWLFEAKDSAH